jgi:uncharacterized protein YndB with AHSA1/START domain
MFEILKLERSYASPPEKVWVALTDRTALAEWLMPNDFAPVVGHRFRFQVDPGGGFSGVIDCEVLEVDPCRKLVYTWAMRPTDPKKPRPRPTTVTWRLTPFGAGTRLSFEHAGLGSLPFLFRFMLRFGWGTMVKRWIPKVAAAVGQGGRYTPGVLGSTKYRYQAKTVPAELTKLP